MNTWDYVQWSKLSKQRSLTWLCLSLWPTYTFTEKHTLNTSLDQSAQTAGHPSRRQPRLAFVGVFTRTTQPFQAPPLPFANIKTAVTHTQRGHKEKVYGPEYCVTIHEAMKAVTIDAAWQLHKDDCLGSLKEGKKADLIIVSDNPFKVITLLRKLECLSSHIHIAKDEI